jgi:alkylation response protein AidB-like acyl-CoA dehydrogenase
MTVIERNVGIEIDPVDEVVSFLEENWDPDLTVGEWWERLGGAGWAAPMLPIDSYGRGLNRADAMRVQRAIAKFGALGATAGMGISMVSPTIAAHGTREQIDRYIPEAVSGKKAWCQLFSEPGAGSDLAGLSTKAVRHDDEWIINGQKVWTSGGHRADMGMLLARTDPTAPKHQGITWFAFDMNQPGVDVRPLREMTGNTMFSEVFFTDARVSNDAAIGALNDGWKVANTTLFHERSGMGAGGVAREGVGPTALAGTKSGHLERRAGDFVPKRKARASATPAAAPTKRSSPAQQYIELARTFGKDTDPVIRQGLAHLHILRELARLTTERHKAVRASGGDIPGVPNFSKLLMGHTVRHTRDLGMQILGARGLLHVNAGDEGDLSEEPGGRAAITATAQALGAQALPIFGGTDQIQMNIIGERVLGLPKDPGDLSTVPFNELPKNG